MSVGFEWISDSAGDELRLNGEFLGCIYNKDWYRRAYSEYCLLVGDDLEFLKVIKGNRQDARRELEIHFSPMVPLPSARELLEMG